VAPPAGGRQSVPSASSRSRPSAISTTEPVAPAGPCQSRTRQGLSRPAPADVTGRPPSAKDPSVHRPVPVRNPHAGERLTDRHETPLEHLEPRLPRIQPNPCESMSPDQDQTGLATAHVHAAAVPEEPAVGYRGARLLVDLAAWAAKKRKQSGRPGVDAGQAIARADESGDVDDVGFEDAQVWPPGSRLRSTRAGAGHLSTTPGGCRAMPRRPARGACACAGRPG
jgi:hypothetical protein